MPQITLKLVEIMNYSATLRQKRAVGDAWAPVGRPSWLSSAQAMAWPASPSRSLAKWHLIASFNVFYSYNSSSVHRSCRWGEVRAST